jgi:hypothetical protein
MIVAATPPMSALMGLVWVVMLVRWRCRTPPLSLVKQRHWPIRLLLASQSLRVWPMTTQSRQWLHQMASTTDCCRC